MPFLAGVVLGSWAGFTPLRAVFPYVNASPVQWGISAVLSIVTNQKLLRPRATPTPAPIPNFAIVRGTKMGKAIAPARGVMATIQRSVFRFIPTGSEPLCFGFAGWIAVVFRCHAFEIQGDVALLFAIGGSGFDGIHLLSVAERNLNAEGSFVR